MYYFNDDGTRVEVEKSESIVAGENKYCNYTGSPAVPLYNKEFHMACYGNMFEFFIILEGGALASNDMIFNLKPDYRPITRLVFPIIETGNKKIVGSCQVFEGGDCRVWFDNGQPRDVAISGAFVREKV